MQGFIKTFADDDLQAPRDVAVVIPTILRPELTRALHSIFAQDFGGRVQVLVGIDTPRCELGLIEAACAARPSHCAVQVFWPGYSTARRNGGLGMAGDGGVLRSVLSYLGNAPYIAYLDDDNWWRPDHLRLMCATIAEAEWAFALRWFVHPQTQVPVAVDLWESLGPGAGIYNERFGGFVDPSCLMINKLACPLAIPRWNFPLASDPMSADRTVFRFLAKRHHGKCTGQPSVFYTMNERDGMHEQRVMRLGAAYEKAGEVQLPDESL